MFQTSDGISLNVDEDGHGAPFVFQHGLGGDASQTQDVFPQAAGFRRITLECRGHGRSQAGPVDALSIEYFAADIVAFIQANLAAPIAIGGISMGAAIAMNIAVRHPELASALVIARPAWLFERGPANMIPNRVAGHLLRTIEDREAARTAFEASPVARDLELRSPDNLATLRGVFDAANRQTLSELLIRISADGPGLTDEDIAGIGVPTLVIGTDQDVVHPFDYATTIAALIPDAKLAKITSKSVSRVEYAREFRRKLQLFLALGATGWASSTD